MNVDMNSARPQATQHSYSLNDLSRNVQSHGPDDVEARAGLPPPNHVGEAETDDEALGRSWIASQTKASRRCCSNMSRSMKMFLGIAVLLLIVAVIVIIDRTLANVSGTTDFDPHGDRK